MNARLIQLAGLSFLMAFASPGAFAQDALGAAPNGLSSAPNALTTPPNGLGTAPNALGNAPNALGPAPSTLGGPSLGTLPLPEPWTVENITPAQPFGNVDISRAGTTTAQVRTWAQGRTPMERNELSGRCQVISDPANSSRYPANAQEFCRTYSAMQVITPPTLKY
jgi:hypothetical protein